MPGIGRRRIGSGVRRGGRRGVGSGFRPRGLQCAIERAVMVAAEFFTVNGELTQGGAPVVALPKNGSRKPENYPRIPSGSVP